MQTLQVFFGIFSKKLWQRPTSAEICRELLLAQYEPVVYNSSTIAGHLRKGLILWTTKLGLNRRNTV